MKQRTKLLVSIITTLSVLVMCIGLLIYFVLRVDNSNNNKTPDVTDEFGYTDKDKEVFEETIKQVVQFEAITETIPSTESWRVDVINKTIKNLMDAIQKAGISKETFNKLITYLKGVKSELDNLSFDFSGVFDDNGEITIENLLEILSRSENINGIYKIMTDYYTTGMTNESTARVLYYFIGNELKLFDEYRRFLYLTINLAPETETEIAVSFVESLIYDLSADVITLYANLEQSAVEGFIVRLLNTVNFLVDIYRDFNIYTIKNYIEIIKEGGVTAEEISLLADSFVLRLNNLRVANSGKFFDLTSDLSESLDSMITLLPLFSAIISNMWNVPNLTLTVVNVINSASAAENYLNRLCEGLINCLENINSNRNIRIVDENGNVIGKTSLAQAIIDNFREIFTDDGVEVNTDTVIIFSKIFSGLFENDAINLNYTTSFLSSNNDLMVQIMSIISQIYGVETTSSQQQEALNNYKSYLLNLSSLIITFGKLDLGTPEARLLDISVSYIHVEEYIQALLMSINDIDILAFAGILVDLTIMIGLPIILPLVPYLMVYGGFMAAVSGSVVGMIGIAAGGVIASGLTVILSAVMGGMSGQELNRQWVSDVLKDIISGSIDDEGNEFLVFIVSLLGKTTSSFDLLLEKVTDFLSLIIVPDTAIDIK